MPVNEKEQTCHMCQSDYCQLLARGDCQICPAQKMTVQERETLMDHIDAVHGLLPEGGAYSLYGTYILYETENCQFCAQEKPHKKSGYALTDYGYIDSGDGTIAGQLQLGKKVGRILPLQIACCDRCRANLRAVRLYPSLFTAAGFALGLVLMAISSLRYAALKIHFSVPLLCFLLCGLLGWGAGRIWKRAFLRKKSGETRFGPEKIPYIAQMEKEGWFPLSKKGKETRLVFSKSLLKRGWYC